MSSLGDFLDAMVKLRAQKAQVAEYNASQRISGMEALGQGIGGLVSNYTSGRRQSAKDAMQNRLDEMSLALDQQKLNQTGIADPLADVMRNQANPPRAMAVDPRFQAAADMVPRPGQISYQDQPINPTVARGGQAGLKNYLDLAKGETAEQRAQIAKGRLDETITHHQELEDAKAQGQKDKMAMDAMSQTHENYQKDVKVAHAHNTGMTAALSQAAGAKTQGDWEKAVTVITGLYQAGTKQGFKDLPFPKIPPSPDQKAAATTAVTNAANQDTWHWYNPGSWGNPSPEAIAAKQKEAQAGVYQYGGPAEYELAPEPTPPSTRPQDYYPGGPGSPQTTPQGQPSGGGKMAPEGTTVTNSKGQKLIKQGGKWVLVQ